MRLSRFHKLLAAGLFLLIAVAITFDAGAQINRKSVKKNNKRIASFRGKKAHFGKDKVYNTVGVSLNALNYYGDLSPLSSRFSTDISFTRPAIGLSFVHRFGPRYTLVGSFLYGTLKGSDNDSADPDDVNARFRYVRNLEFRSRIKELSAVAVFDLYENMATYISRVKWTPYAGLGLAVFHHEPKARVPATDLNGVAFTNAGEWVKLRPLGTEGQYSTLDPGDVNSGIKKYKNIQAAIPGMVGARFRLNEVVDLWAELGFRYTFTDYLDDVSGNYVDLGVFGNNELAKALSYRSNEPVVQDSNNENITAITSNTQTYTGRDGTTYTVVSGFGREHPENLRGKSGQKDLYMVTSFRLTYIIGKTFHRAKFR
jgi:hypothetical protein